MVELDISIEGLALLLFNSCLCLVVRGKSTSAQMKPGQSCFGTLNEIYLKTGWSWLREGAETLSSTGDDCMEAMRVLLFHLDQIMNLFCT